MVTFGVAMFPSGTPGYLAECANGDYNQHWANIANNIAAAGLKNADLRMGWEFNGNWFIWSNIGKEADFARCFRNVVTSMRQAQPNAGITFDWNPASVSGFTSETAWPGDQYVDYVGLDLYDEQSTSEATTIMDQIAAFAKKHHKKLVFPEWGLSSRGNGDNPNYINKMH
jgi:beta-mannanase